jgi:hypothetical protein
MPELGAMATAMAVNVFARGFNGTEGSRSHESLLASLTFQSRKSIRTSTVILATFNVLAALATAAGILYDCYWASKRSSRNFRASYVDAAIVGRGADSDRKLFIRSIHPAETFPLVLAIGIIIQGLIFVAVQGLGLQSLDITGCTLIAQFMFPGM